MDTTRRKWWFRGGHTRVFVDAYNQFSKKTLEEIIKLRHIIPYALTKRS